MAYDDSWDVDDYDDDDDVVGLEDPAEGRMALVHRKLADREKIRVDKLSEVDGPGYSPADVDKHRHSVNWEHRRDVSNDIEEILMESGGYGRSRYSSPEMARRRKVADAITEYVLGPRKATTVPRPMPGSTSLTAQAVISACPGITNMAAQALAKLQDGDPSPLEGPGVTWGEPQGDPVHTRPYRIDFADGSAIQAAVAICG